MSIGILINVHDGVVLAADSASTLTLSGVPGQPTPIAINVYNNANKIANLLKGEPVGCVAYGSGSIGNASISTLLKDFRRRLTDGEETAFDRQHYTMESVSTLLLDFLKVRIDELQPTEPKPSIGIMLGGFSKQQNLGEGWIISIENGITKEPRLLRATGDVGLNWGGEQESIARLILGFSPLLMDVLQTFIKPQPSPEQLAELTTLLRDSLQAPLVFAPMPIQDAIDLAEWLVHTAEMFSRFIPGPTSVGGPIESAAITKHEGFRWIRRKHYYRNELNPEVTNGNRVG
jgi:hypothetical protein